LAVFAFERRPYAELISISASEQAYVSPILRWAESEELIPHDFSRSVIRVGSEVKRERILTHAEIKAIWNAAGGLTGIGASYGRLVRFLLLSGARRMEGATLRHGDVLDGTWRLKAADNKSGRPHRLKLPPPALELVGTGEARELAFAGDSGGVLSGFSKFKAALDKASGVHGWRLHDLRRTFASGLQELGVDQITIHACLNHQLPGLSGVYLRAELEAAKAAAVRDWSAELQRIVGEKRAVS
jgi:integrase